MIAVFMLIQGIFFKTLLIFRSSVSCILLQRGGADLQCIIGSVTTAASSQELVATWFYSKLKNSFLCT